MKGNRLKQIALISVFASLGGSVSVLVGYGGSLLSILAGSSPVISQSLAGLHVFWLMIPTFLIDRKGTAVTTGALKGMVEATLFSHLGVYSFLVSLTQGAVIDLVLLTIGKNHAYAIYLAGGLGSASNILILQLFLLLSFSPSVIVLSYVAAFLSGLIFGGYISKKVLRAITVDPLAKEF